MMMKLFSLQETINQISSLNNRLQSTTIINDNNDTIFLPIEYIHDYVIVRIKFVFITVSILYIISLYIVSYLGIFEITESTSTSTSTSTTQSSEKYNNANNRNNIDSQNSHSNNDNNNNNNNNVDNKTEIKNNNNKEEYYDDSTILQRRMKLAYQITNCIINLLLGLYGLYYDMFYQPWIRTPLLLDKITEYEYYTIFSCIQIGYQLWSLPIGILFINESYIMIVHHIAVLFVCSMSGFLQCGFRYWTPYCYGAIELSSVPLAIMNIMKDNPIWIQHYNIFYLWIRLIFSILFLLLRVVFFTYRMIHILLYEYLFIVYSIPNSNVYYKVYMIIVWISTFLLLVLQLYWGQIVTIGLIKVFYPHWLSSSSSSNETNDNTSNIKNDDNTTATTTPSNSESENTTTTTTDTTTKKVQ